MQMLGLAAQMIRALNFKKKNKKKKKWTWRRCEHSKSHVRSPSTTSFSASSAVFLFTLHIGLVVGRGRGLKIFTAWVHSNQIYDRNEENLFALWRHTTFVQRHEWGKNTKPKQHTEGDFLLLSLLSYRCRCHKEVNGIEHVVRRKKIVFAPRKMQCENLNMNILHLSCPCTTTTRTAEPTASIYIYPKCLNSCA